MTQNQRHVLIIEDDTPILEALSELLMEEGYLVTTAANGQEGLDLLREMSDLPNLILLDLMMPIKDGRDFRAEQEMNPAWADIPVVLMSADTHIEIKKLSIGLRTHIRKPLDIDQILETVRYFCA